MKGARGVPDKHLPVGLDMTLFEVDRGRQSHSAREVDPEAKHHLRFDLRRGGSKAKMRISVVATGIDAEVVRAGPRPGHQPSQQTAMRLPAPCAKRRRADTTQPVADAERRASGEARVRRSTANHCRQAAAEARDRGDTERRLHRGRSRADAGAGAPGSR